MKKILIIGFVWPEPTSSAAGRRILDLIGFFKELQYEITFVSTAKKTPFSADLSNYGVFTKFIKLNDVSFDELVTSLKPDIVLFDRYMTEEQFGWRVAEYCPEALRILDTEDLHFLRNAREASIKKYGDLSNIELYTDLAKREIASIYRCDLALIISEFEIELLQKTFHIPSYLLLYFPLITCYSISNNQKHSSFSQRSHFVSIGNFRHAPNKDAVLHLKRKLWPEIRREIPNVELHIYGAYCPEEIQALHSKSEGFLVKGRVTGVFEIMSYARAYLAPLRFGAGIKGKLLDAMEQGLPGVTTSIGAEGMRYNSKWNGFISDDINEFVDNAIKLYENEDIWKQSEQNGYDILLQKFSKETAYKTLSESIVRINNILKEHRKKNFVGAMLLHHTLQSTRYLSKYIELKNKDL